MDSGLGIGGLAISKDEVSSSSFDVFSPIEIENSLSKASKIVTRPIASSNSRGPFKFIINADPVKWTDCESIRLSGKVKLQKKTENTLSNFDDTANEISTVNNFFQSLYSSIICTVNGVEITDPSGNWYPYKSYLETLLSYSKSTKEGRLQSHCYFTDKANHFDSLGQINGNGKTTTESANDGYVKRKEKFKNSKFVYFNIPLNMDLCTVRKYLPPGLKLEFEFHRSPDAFSLLSPYAKDNCAIVLENLTLVLTRYTPSSSIQKFYQDGMIKNKKCVIPMDRSLIKSYT
jgi:hypothetical protein